MEGNAFQMSQQISPPLIARLLVYAIVQSEDREILLGDLLEEFEAKQIHSRSAANSWYWWQAIFSTPYLLLSRLRSPGLKQFALVVFITVVAFLIISLWDIYVARSSARYLASLFSSIPLLVIRTLYFLIQCIGAALIGGLLAQLAFSQPRTFFTNSIHCLGPVILILIISALVTFTVAGGSYPNLYIVLRAVLSSVSLLGGAYLIDVIYKKSKNKS